MVRVRVGIRNLLGYVNISLRDYEWDMARNGGTTYFEVFTAEGVFHYRCKYFREIEEVLEATG